MNNKALYDFINEACKQDDTDIDISIAELTSAIHTLEKEKEKRMLKKRSSLIQEFLKAYANLKEYGIKLAYLFDADYVNSMVDNISDDYVLVIDDSDCFEFD